ncbi:MAG: hypothetical protein EOO74_12535, partial [Myxococcales bacterium]
MARRITARGSGRRVLDVEVLLLPLAGLLLGLIGFLLITARMSQRGRLNLNAQMVGRHRGDG